jgi:hypothetical protein
MDKEEFMQEYLSRLAFSMAQFWPSDEALPDAAAFADQDFYAGAIRRLSVLRRSELAKKMWAFVEEKAKFFSSETPRANRIRTIRGVIDRFPLLQEADHEATFKNDCI